MALPFLSMSLRYTLLDQSPPTLEIKWLCVDIDGYKIVNVYKPAPTWLQSLDLPEFPHPCLYAGHFNCCHADWGYNNNSLDGECLAGWASINCFAFLYNAKDASSFCSGHWNMGANSDLSFASIGPNNHLLNRCVLEKLPRSQHWPLLITTPRFALSVPTMFVNWWNFHKAKWSDCIVLTNKFTTLLPPDSLDVDAAYQDFCNIIKKAAKNTIPYRYQNNYIPCWDAKYESLYRTFLQSPLLQLYQAWQEVESQWLKPVWSIDFSQSSWKVWSILNNFTGRSQHSPCHCPVSTSQKREIHGCWLQVISTCLSRSVQPLEGHNTRPSKYLLTLFHWEYLLLPFNI